MKKTILLISILIINLFVLSACGGAPAAPAPVDQGPTVDPNLVFTSGAQTVVAQITLDAANRPVPSIAVPPTQTMDPNLMPTMDPAAAPTDGSLPALPALPGAETPGAPAGAFVTLPAAGVVPTLGTVNTLAPAAPAAPAGTYIAPVPDKLQWVSNTPPDKSTIKAGSKFRITWKLSNVGTTTWDNTYSFKHYAGVQLATQNTYPVSKDIAPNKSIDFTVDCVAPTTAGDVYSLWVLQRKDGVNVGKFDITLTIQ